METVPISRSGVAYGEAHQDAVEAALTAYRDAARGVSPDPTFVIPRWDGAEVEATEIETLLAVARQRALGGRLRRVLIPPLWEPKGPLAVRRGIVRALLRLLAEHNDDSCEQKDLTAAFHRHLESDTYTEVISSLDREPRLRTVSALIGALRASDAYGFASQFESIRNTLIGAGLVAAWYWAIPLMLRSMVLMAVFQVGITLLVLLALWGSSKRHRKPCEPLLQMLEQVEITDLKTQRRALEPIRMLAKRGSAQPKRIREQAQRLTRRRWEHSAEFLPISAASPSPTIESLPVPSDTTEASARSD